MQVMKRPVPLLLLLAGVFLLGAQVEATSVLKMNLDEMCASAHQVYRGEVVGISNGSVEVGGGTMATVTYTIAVSDAIVGEFDVVKGQQMAQITMVAPPKAITTASGATRRSMLPELPQLRQGGEYLLLTTAPSAAGLSTTVGLGQGCFEIDKEGIAANELRNAGLSATINGPVSYTLLADEIRAATGQ